MAFELVGAVLVAALVLWLVFEPFLTPPHPALQLPEPPAPEETRRGAALLALKEIEFDRETGKLSDEDYAMLKARYSVEALEAMAADDAQQRADAATRDPEVLIAKEKERLRGARTQGESAPPTCPACGPRPEGDARFCSHCGRSVGRAFCSSCGGALEAESRFCGDCGTAVAA